MKKNKKINTNKDSSKLLIAVLASMIIIITVWCVYFYPLTKKNDQEPKKTKFDNFFQEIKETFSIFNNKKQAEQDIDINDLRQRVFGDKIEK